VLDADESLSGFKPTRGSAERSMYFGGTTHISSLQTHEGFG